MPFCKNCRRHNTQQSFAGVRIAKCRRCGSRICRVCGCTNERACRDGCAWSLLDPTCCTEHESVGGTAEPPATAPARPAAAAA